jgi:sugar transferase (PEP-CTERM/EpsH1 system associated)
MKILIISHFVPYPPHGGALQRNFNLLKEVSKKNEIHLLTFTQKILLPDEIKLQDSIRALKNYCNYIKVLKISTDFSKIRWILLLFFNLFSLTPYSVWRFKSKAMVREIENQLEGSCFDLVQIDTIALAQYAGIAPCLPKVLVHQNVESALLLRRSINEKNPLIRLYLFLQGKKLRRYERRITPTFGLNITVSELDRTEFKKYIPQIRIEVIPNGTDIEYFKPTESVEPNDIIFVGGLTWYPNKDAMLYFCREIFPIIKEKLSGVRMNIVGRYPPREIQKLSANDKDINLVGYADDVRPHIAKAGVYVVPIRVGGGTRLKILDAMAMGKAILSTSVGAEGLEVAEGKDILVANEPEDFANKAVKILTTPALRRYLEKNARETVVKRYAWPKIAKNLEETYRDLASA